VEDKFIREVIFGSPNNPPNSSINKAILVATDIDALHQWKPEIPFEFWINEWCNKSTTSCVNMNWSVPSTKS
jgi:hypothetical protein